MILGLCGSPRKQATEYVLREALKIISESGLDTKFFSVQGKNISFCQHCDYCVTNKQCMIKDDMFDLYPLLQDARGLVIATPVYNGGISAQTKTVMDRCRALLTADPNLFRHKIDIAIAVGGDRIGGQELAIQQINTFFILNGIIPISGGAFGANLGATFWSSDTLEGVKTDEEGFKSLRKTVRRYIEALQRLHPK